MSSKRKLKFVDDMYSQHQSASSIPGGAASNASSTSDQGDMRYSEIKTFLFLHSSKYMPIFPLFCFSDQQSEELEEEESNAFLRPIMCLASDGKTLVADPKSLVRNMINKYS